MALNGLDFARAGKRRKPRAKPPGIPRRMASTLALKVPRCDWSRIRVGEKREVRMTGASPLFDRVDLPRPIVVYSYVRHRAEPDAKLMVLEDYRAEPLGAISAESLAREGYDTIADFRRYWIERTGAFKPLSRVLVYQLRPWQPDDLHELAAKILTELYEPWLP